MIIFCFLPVHGLMFSSSSEEKEWENIVAYIPSQRAAEIAFSQKSSWFCEYFMDSQGSETPETRSLTLPNLPVFGKSRKMESEQRMWEKLDGETTFGEGS